MSTLPRHVTTSVDISNQLSIKTSTFPEPHGINEYRQYLKSIDSDESLDNARLVKADQGALLRYKVDIEEEGHGSLTIRLSEHTMIIGGGQTNGGSSFLITRIPGERCWITDYSNGSYCGGCPPSRIKGCFDLVIIRQSTWYALYRQKRNPMQAVIVNRKMCINVTANSEIFSRYQYHEPASWTPFDYNSTIITHHYGEPITLLTPEEICNRLSLKYDHISMVGASHIRYMFDYLMMRCFVNFPSLEDVLGKHESLRVGNIDFKSTKYAYDFPENIDQEFMQFNLTKGSLILAQYGAHDLFKGRFLETMEKGQEIFMSSIERSCRSGVKVFVLATPPFPDNDRIISRRTMRNNYALAAFNWKTLLNIRRLKVYILSIF